MSCFQGKIPVLVIFAPTASGKTEVVGHLFSDNVPSFFAGKAEIINCDSMQVYRRLNIGTAKPEKNFLEHLPHHLIDICEPCETFGSGCFLESCDELCKKITEKGKLPVICGGSSFYIKNFIFGSPPTPKSDEKIRNKILSRMETEGNHSLYEELKKVDPLYALKIHENDKTRIGRALEVFYSSGKPLSDFLLSCSGREEYEFCTIYLYRNREDLYSRINRRVLNMFDSGLVLEVKDLLQGNCGEKLSINSACMRGIGYNEFFTCGEDPLEMFRLSDQNSDFIQTDRYLVWLSEVKRQIQRNSRNYAKKQITFFEKIINLPGNPACVNVICADDFEKIENTVKEFYS
ncbi:MAG: tRNA (adenosine(37)-N6)-dimethylallyltransferase MiaA [Treponemataceae bacterium]